MSERVTGIATWQGINASDDPASLTPGQCVELLNAETSAGTIRRRPGFRLLAAEEVTDAQWPPYLPPVETPDIAAVIFYDVVLPTMVIQGDAFALRMEAQDRSGNALTEFADGTGMSLVVQADDGGGWEAFAGLALAAGGSPDPTTGWTAGVWEQQCVVADIGAYTRLRVRLLVESVVQADDTATFAALAEIVVDLPAAITPDVAFKLQLEALDGDAATLLEYTGTGLSLQVLGDDEETVLAFVDENGDALDLTSGWDNGKWEKMVVLADPDGQGGVIVDVMFDSESLGGTSANITQLWLQNGPSVLQSYKQATFKITARTATGADWEDYDGANASWTIELRAPDGTWSAYAGLTDAAGDPLDITAGWVDGVWEQTVQFAEADGDYVRLVFSSYGIEQWTWQIAVWPIYTGELIAPGACAAGTAFSVSALVLDERGYLLIHYAGQDLTLTATDENGDAVAITDGEGEALDLTAGWDEGLWTGQVMFAAEGLESLTLALSWTGTELATATLIVGESAPGEVAEIAMWAPYAANPGEEFPVVLTAYDAFGAVVTDYDGTGLSLAAVGHDADSGEDVDLVVASDALAEGWDGGVWQGVVTLEAALACETMTLTALLGSAESGAVEIYIAMTFVLSVPATVQTGNTFLVAILAVNPDGTAAADYVGEDLELQAFISQGGSWVEASVGTVFLTDPASWNSGRFSQALAAPAVGTYKFVLLHQEEEEGSAEIIVTADMVSDGGGIPEDDEAGTVVTMSVSLPNTVWPGCPFTIGVSANVEGQLGSQASVDPAGRGSLAVSPGVTPTPSLESGWSGLSWSDDVKLSDPASTGELTATVTCVPDLIPEGREPSDFVSTAVADIGVPDFSVSLPATMRTGVSGTLRIAIRGNGSVLSTYEGDGFSLRVDKYVNGAWTTDSAALVTSTGAAIPTTFRSGTITVQVKLGGSIGDAEKVRVTALFNGSDAASDEADVISKWDAALSGLTYLHPYLPAQTLAIAVETYGSDFAAGDVSVSVEARQGGGWVAFPYLTDSLGQAIDWTEHWTGTAFSLAVAISQAGDFTKARIVVTRNATVIGSLEFGVSEAMQAFLTPDATLYAGVAFDLTIVVKDLRGNTLTLYDGSGASLLGTDLDDGATMTNSDVTTGWTNGQWDGTATISAATDSFRIAMVYEDIFADTIGYEDVSVAAITGALVDAILQRQKAASIDSGSWINPAGLYTLAQLCTYGNTFTDGLPSGTYWLAEASNDWDGGASAPTTRTYSATYFGIVGSGATVEVDDEYELFAAVIAYRKLKATLGVVGSDQEEWEGVFPLTDYQTEATAKAGAQAAWTGTALGNTMPYARASLSNPSGSLWSANIRLTRCKVNSDLRVGSNIGRRVRQYYLAAAISQWGDHGFDVENGQYAAYTDETFASGVATDGVYPGSSAALSAWPTLSGSPPQSDMLGFQATGGFAIVDPEFDY